MKPTEHAKTLSAVNEFHAVWTARDSQGRGSGGFKLALARERPDLFRCLRLHADLMARLPAEVLTDWAGIKPRGVGKETLRALMPRIAAAWVHSPAPRSGFDKFVNQLLAECPTAEKLRARLDALV